MRVFSIQRFLVVTLAYAVTGLAGPKVIASHPSGVYFHAYASDNDHFGKALFYSADHSLIRSTDILKDHQSLASTAAADERDIFLMSEELRSKEKWISVYNWTSHSRVTQFRVRYSRELAFEGITYSYGWIGAVDLLFLDEQGNLHVILVFHAKSKHPSEHEFLWQHHTFSRAGKLLRFQTLRGTAEAGSIKAPIVAVYHRSTGSAILLAGNDREGMSVLKMEVTENPRFHGWTISKQFLGEYAVAAVGNDNLDEASPDAMPQVMQLVFDEEFGAVEFVGRRKSTGTPFSLTKGFALHSDTHLLGEQPMFDGLSDNAPRFYTRLAGGAATTVWTHAEGPLFLYTTTHGAGLVSHDEMPAMGLVFGEPFTSEIPCSKAIQLFEDRKRR